MSVDDRVNAVAACRHCNRLEPVRLAGELYASVPVCCGDAAVCDGP